MELNVFFEDPFWIGMFYLNNGKDVYVEKVVFGNEPRDVEVYNYILYQFQTLPFRAKFLASVKSRPKNPKRMLRIIKKQSLNLSLGTKSMQALKKQFEHSKQEKRTSQRQFKENRKDYLFQLKQEKRKAKKRGH